MKHIPYLYIGAFTFLIACSSEERITTTDSNEEPSGPIELSAGIAEGNSKATTRTGAEDHHTTPGHQTFTSDTKIALRINGTWTGHSPSEEIVETTTASLNGVAQDTNDKHNKLSCSPVLYWEDYGTSDINNMGTGQGREKGLTIYGAAVDGATSVPSGLISSGSTIDGTIEKWTSLGWTLDANQSSGFSSKDLLISNNISGDNGATYQYDYGRYLFDQRTLGKLLEFKHALSKITVNLKAGDGFTGGNFANAPEVKLTSNAGTPTTSWAKTTGTVNITDGTVSPTDATAVITMWQAATPTSGYNVTKEALVMPHSVFGGNTGTYPIILRINADNNIYYVTSEMIRQAIDGIYYTNGTGFETEAGKNYIINVRVNQTDVSVKVTATVANWTDVSATQVAPVINVSGNLGGTASGWTADNTFSFYRSEYLNSGYSSGVSKVNGYYPEESVLSYTHSSTSWSMSPSLYWPNHNTHYQFRAVWPQTVTIEGAGVLSSPRVEDGSGATASCQVIKVKNVAYSAGSFPSDLMIARPEIDPSTYCSNTETSHTPTLLYSGGICATEGTINLNFRYMMSRVEVNLTTSKDGDADYPATVNLNKAQVEIVNVHKTGDVKLGDKEVIPTGVKSATPDPATDTFGNYILGNYSYNDGTKTATYSSAIVPQTLTYTSALHANNVMFRITIYKNGDPSQGVDDIYYADIQPIAVKVTGSSVSAAPVTNWESGVHYVYNLRLTKTNVQVTASLTNWSTVNADHTVWF